MDMRKTSTPHDTLKGYMEKGLQEWHSMMSSKENMVGAIQSYMKIGVVYSQSSCCGQDKHSDDTTILTEKGIPWDMGNTALFCDRHRRAACWAKLLLDFPGKDDLTEISKDIARALEEKRTSTRSEEVSARRTDPATLQTAIEKSARESGVRLNEDQIYSLMAEHVKRWCRSTEGQSWETGVTGGTGVSGASAPSSTPVNDVMNINNLLVT